MIYILYKLFTKITTARLEKNYFKINMGRGHHLTQAVHGNTE